MFKSFPTWNKDNEPKTKHVNTILVKCSQQNIKNLNSS